MNDNNNDIRAYLGLYNNSKLNLEEKFSSE